MDGLRTSDATSLFVLTQDLIGQTLGRLAPETLADLFALAELEDQLPKPMVRDLAAFVRQKTREIQDLPDGDPVLDFLEDLKRLPPRSVPANLRPVVLAIDSRTRLSAEGAELVRDLARAWEATPPAPIRLPTRQVKNIQKAETPVRLQSPSQQEETRKSAREGTPRVRTPTAMKDQRKTEWVRECLADRLAEYGDRGLKEAVLVAGLLHRSPFEDLTDAEILAELRALKREGRVATSAGRWSLLKRVHRP